MEKLLKQKGDPKEPFFFFGVFSLYLPLSVSFPLYINRSFILDTLVSP
jgi:hypothetical protein